MFDRFYCIKHLSRLMTKPTKWPCAQRRLRSVRHPPSLIRVFAVRMKKAWVLDYLPTERTAKTLIRLGGCPGWSESSLGAQSFCWFCHQAAHFAMQEQTKTLEKILWKMLSLSRHYAAECHVLKLLPGTVITLCWRHEITSAIVHVLVLTADFVTAPECYN